MKFYTL